MPGQVRTAHFQCKAILAARTGGLTGSQAVVFVGSYLDGPALDWFLALLARDSFFVSVVLNDLQHFMEALGKAFPDKPDKRVDEVAC